MRFCCWPHRSSASLLLSFWTQNFLTIERDFTSANYAEALTDPLYRGVDAAVVADFGDGHSSSRFVLAFSRRLFISFHVRPERKSLWLFLITIPFWTSYLIRVFPVARHSLPMTDR